MQNVIQRELTINASAERIYNAIADAQQVVKWFPEAVSGEYREGGQAIMSFGELGQSSIYIEAMTPYRYFAYRWVPGSSHFVGDVRAVPNTLVEFRIEELASGGCKVSLTETGFADLPMDIAEVSYGQNCRGWDFMLQRLQQYFSTETK